MVGFIATLIGTGLALWVTTLIYPDISFGKDPELTTILAVSLLFGIVNAIIKPILRLLSLPVRVATLGLFSLVVNGILLILVAWLAGVFDVTFSVGGYPPDFGLDAIIAAVIGAIVLGIVGTVINWLPFLQTSR